VVGHELAHTIAMNLGPRTVHGHDPLHAASAGNVIADSGKIVIEKPEHGVVLRRCMRRGEGTVHGRKQAAIAKLLHCAAQLFLRNA
jgi:hypothetical protein